MAAVAARRCSGGDFLCAAFRAARVPGAEHAMHGNCRIWRFAKGSMLGAMIALLLWLGLYPQPVFHMFAQAANQFPALWR